MCLTQKTDNYLLWMVKSRQDADPGEIQRMKNDPDGYCKVWRQFQTTHKPSYWVVWPYSKSKGWCDRLTGNL